MNKFLLDKFFRRINKFNALNKPKFEAETIRLLAGYLQVVMELTETANCSLDVEYFYDGMERASNLLEDGSFVFNNLFLNIQKYPPVKSCKDYLDITRMFLDKNTVPYQLKAQLIIFEFAFIETLINCYLKDSDIGITSINKRLDIISFCLAGKVEEALFSGSALAQTYSILTNSMLNILTLKGQLIQCLNCLEERLSSANSAIERSCLIKLLVNYSTSYNLLSKRDLEDRLNEFNDCLDKDELELIKLEIDTDTRSANFYSFKMSTGTLSLQNTLGKNISTLIRFSIPIEFFYDKPVAIDNDEGKPKIFITPIQTFWADPMFEAFMNFKIGNIGWSYFSDLIVESEGTFCHVIIDIKGLYAPDVELLETTSESVDFSEKEQIEGRRYYPHKEFAIKNLIEAFEVLEKVTLIKNKKEITANLFSNFIVQYVDNELNATIKSVLYALTCHDSFTKTRSKFLEKLASRNLSDTYISLRSLLSETSIESERNLREFVERTLILVVKNNIENEGGYTYFWKDTDGGGKIPCTEPQLQPYVLGHLKIIYEYMGIQISREIVSANGEIDFLVTFNNSKNELLRVCVELKLAHNTKLESGINKQLPKYMSAERTKQGIFLVLWFKCKQTPYVFNNPPAYESLEQLEEKLISINKDKNITIVTIDCSKPTAPSKL